MASFEEVRKRGGQRGGERACPTLQLAHPLTTAALLTATAAALNVPPPAQTYILKQIRMNSDDVRLLKSYPAPWQVRARRGSTAG